MWKDAVANATLLSRRQGYPLWPAKLKPGATTNEAELIAFCRQRLAHFKAPKSVVFGPLPKTSTGKIQKFVLREQAAALSGPST